MRLSALLAAAIALAMVSSAQAVQLVVMSVNSNPGVAGYKAYTIGVRINQVELYQPGVGSIPFLLVQSITFAGGANGPYNNTGAANKPDIQAVQTAYIDNAIANSGNFPPTNADLSANGSKALYQDSWWYNNGSTGTLRGAIDSFGDDGTVTTSNGGTIGPTANVGATGYLFRQLITGFDPANATNGQSMEYTGAFGPTFSLPDQSPLVDLFTDGVLTVPLAQILINGVGNGQLTIPDEGNVGFGQYIAIGNLSFDLWGMPAGTETPLVLDYYTDTIHPTPEPATLVLITIGAIGLLITWGRRKN